MKKFYTLEKITAFADELVELDSNYLIDHENDVMTVVERIYLEKDYDLAVFDLKNCCSYYYYNSSNAVIVGYAIRSYIYFNDLALIEIENGSLVSKDDPYYDYSNCCIIEDFTKLKLAVEIPEKSLFIESGDSLKDCYEIKEEIRNRLYNLDYYDWDLIDINILNNYHEIDYRNYSVISSYDFWSNGDIC